MRRTILVGAFGVVAGCAGFNRAYGIDPANRSSIEVRSAVPPAAAQEVTFAALVRAGFAVSDQRPGIITVGPYNLSEDAGVKVVLRVAIVADSGGSLAVVTGTVVEDAYAQAMGRALAGTQGDALMRGEPIREATAGRGVKKWVELVRASDAIRTVLSP